MAPNNQMYRVAEFNIPGITQPDYLATVLASLSDSVRGINPNVEFKHVRGSTRIDVYIPHPDVDTHIQEVLGPLATKLEQFKERHSRNGNPTELTVYDLRYIIQQDIRDREVQNLGDSNRRLLNEAGELRQENSSIRTQNESLLSRATYAENVNEPLNIQIREAKAELGTAATSLEEADQYAVELGKEVSSLKRDALQVSTTPESLVDMLRGNEQLYSRAQEDMITDAYNQVSADIDKREFYEKMEEVNEARETIKLRDEYLAEHGQTAVEDLPQVGRDATLKDWEGAESIIEDYRQYQDGIAPLDVPLRIAKTDAGVTIVIPVNPKSKNKVARSLYNNLITYSADLQSEFSIEASVDDKQPFATLNITGEVDHSTIEDRLLSAFREVAEQAKLNLQPFSFNYFESTLDQKSPVLEAVNPRDYIQSIIRELGYQSQISFSNEKGISGFRNTLFKLSNGAGLENRTLDTLATALGINKSKLEEVIKNYQSSLSGNGSAEPEIVSSVPTEVIDTPKELIPAAERVNPGADYLISKVTEQFGSQKEFNVGTGMRIEYSISRLRSGYELTDELIRKIANHLPGLRWDTLRRNLRP